MDLLSCPNLIHHHDHQNLDTIVVNLLLDDENEEYEDVETESLNEDDGSNTNCVNEVEEALVYLRIRPTTDLEDGTTALNYKISNNILIATGTSIDNSQNVVEKQFTFTDIFNSSINQIEIYENCIRKKIDTQENLTVMSYGTSGSGKTYTLLGDMYNPGIIPRAISNIFELYSQNMASNPIFKLKNGEIGFVDDKTTKETLMVRRSLLGNPADIESSYGTLQTEIINEHNFGSLPAYSSSVFIWISFVEIYNETVFDLLKPEKNNSTSSTHTYNNSKNNSSVRKSGLRVISNDGKVFVKNLTSVYVRNGLEAYKLLTVGLNRITYASTAINDNSSRSHCVFFIDIIKYNQPDVSKVSYKFCDLAGSERLGKTNHIGNRLKEAKRINTSLMVLGRCLDAAYNNQTKKNPDVVPFRESKLTMLLQASLLGKEKMAMLVNITPTDNYYEENLNVLSFASIAKSISYKASKHKSQKTRFSWLSNKSIVVDHSQDNSSNTTQQFDKLFEENMCLREDIRRLNEIRDQELINFENQLARQESALRSELIDMFRKDLKRRDECWEKELKRTRQAEERKYESMKQYYLKKLEEQEQEDDDNEEEETVNLDSSTDESFEKIPKQLRHDKKKRRDTL